MLLAVLVVYQHGLVELLLVILLAGKVDTVDKLPLPELMVAMGNMVEEAVLVLMQLMGVHLSSVLVAAVVL